MEQSQFSRPSIVEATVPNDPMVDMHEGRTPIYSWTPADAPERRYDLYRPRVMDGGRAASTDQNGQPCRQYTIKVESHINGVSSANDADDTEWNLYLSVFEQRGNGKMTIYKSMSVDQAKQRFHPLTREVYPNMPDEHFAHLQQVILKEFPAWKDAFEAAAPLSDEEFKAQQDAAFEEARARLGVTDPTLASDFFASQKFKVE